MALLIPNAFSSYDLTETEVLQGAILTNLQKQVLQNLLAVNAEEKLHLEFDPLNPSGFIQQESYKKGQIDAISYIISSSDIAEATLNNPHFNQTNQHKED